VAHQYVTKPCKPQTLEMMLQNSLGLRRLLTNEALHSRIAKIGSLPSPPAIYNQLVGELQSETANMQKIANLIRQDVSITAKLLQIINSAYFGLPTHVESPLQAVNLLGLDTVKSVVLTAGVFSQFDDPRLPEFSIDQIFNHSIAVGTSARHFANAFGLERRQSEDSLMAGMLHDIGKLVMLTEFKEELSLALKLSERESIRFYEAERRIFGVTHADIGAHLLSLWGLSDSILEAVALHATPNLAPSPMVNVLTAVHLANAIDHDQRSLTNDPMSTYADMAYLKGLGIAGQLPFLRTLCLAEAR
jgi:putative nucleotidyltransferase with HDIG domain